MKQEFLAWLHTQVGQLYVWGGNGEEMTPALIRRMENSEKNADRAAALYELRRAQGKTPILGYDCSGLVSRFLQERGIVEKKRNCNHLAAMCGTVQEMGAGETLRPADLLFRYDGKKPYFHVGVYVGDGMVIESKSRDEGVVKRPLDASGTGYWNRRGRLACFAREPYWGICTGGSVNFREGPGKDHALLGVIHRGDKLLVLPKEGWPQAAVLIGGELCVGYVSPQYLGEAGT